MIEFYCFHCGIKISADIKHAKSSAFCPSCGGAIMVPEAPSDPHEIESTNASSSSDQEPRTRPPKLPSEPMTAPLPPPIPMRANSAAVHTNSIFPQPGIQSPNSPSPSKKKSELTFFGIPFVVCIVIVGAVKLCSIVDNSKPVGNQRHNGRSESISTSSYNSYAPPVALPYEQFKEYSMGYNTSEPMAAYALAEAFARNAGTNEPLRITSILIMEGVDDRQSGRPMRYYCE